MIINLNVKTDKKAVHHFHMDGDVTEKENMRRLLRSLNEKINDDDLFRHLRSHGAERGYNSKAKQTVIFKHGENFAKVTECLFNGKDFARGRVIDSINLR